MAQFQRLMQLAEGSTARLKVRSALNPMLWLVGIGVPLCFGFAWLLGDPMRNWLVIAGIGLIALAALCFVYFMLMRPDSLLSEEYQLRKAALNLIEEKGGKIRVDNDLITDISNPRLPQLPSARADRLMEGRP